MPRADAGEGRRDRNKPPGGIELWLLTAVLTVLYAVAVAIAGRRYVWFDELFTYDIARASTLSRLWRMIATFDCNPPASYLLSRLGMAIVGPNKWGLRLPSILEFYFGSAAIFWYVRRKAGMWFAALAILLLWGGDTFRYAVEARPYALVFACCSSLLLAWDSATREPEEPFKRRRLALSAIALSSVGLFSAHAFAAFSIFPFLLAEAVRWRRRGRPDYPLLAALLLPGVLIVTYIPLIRTYRQMLFPLAFQASFHRLWRFFYNTLHPLIMGLAAGVFAALAFARSGNPGKGQGAGKKEMALILGFLIGPLLLTIVQMRNGSAFWDRYGITTQVALYAAIAIFLGIQFRFRALAGILLSLAMLVVVLHHDVERPLRLGVPGDDRALAWVRPDLPLVDASMLTFFEMNHYERPALLSRLYFLTDRSAAIQYAHTTMFENFVDTGGVFKYFPISAKIDPYREFTDRHPQFLLLDSKNYPEDWLLPKLNADGAQITLLGTYPSFYLDRTLFLVTMPASK